MRYAPFILVGALIAGCGGASEQTVKEPTSSEPSGQPQRKSGQEKRPLSYFESTLRPSDFDREVDEVQRVHIEARPTEQFVIPRDSVVLQEETILGFRIQILTTSSIDDANVSRLAAQQLFFSDSLYVVYDPPVYKVRVGDYESRLEANGRLSDVQERGYKDAWVVPDKVLRRRWVTVARPEQPLEE